MEAGGSFHGRSEAQRLPRKLPRKFSAKAFEVASTKSWRLHPRNFTFYFHGSFHSFQGISAAPTTARTDIFVLYTTVPPVELTTFSTTWLTHTVYETNGDWFLLRPPPQKNSYFLSRTFHGCSTPGMMLWRKYLHVFPWSQITIERRHRGGREHRVSGDTAGSWLWNRRFRSRKVGGATAVARLWGFTVHWLLRFIRLGLGLGYI